jgi:Cu+-exporting ATPase
MTAPTLSTARETITLPVTGMHCAACQARVQRILETAPGVEQAGVNLLLNSATVTFDPGVTSPARLVETVRTTGYGSELPPSDSDLAGEEAERERLAGEESRNLWRKAVVSLVLGGATMVLSLPMLAVPAGVRLVGIPLVTTFVVAWAGRHFYTRAWQSFRHHAADMNTLIAVGTGAAYLYSLIATLAPRLFTARGVAPEVYFEAVILIIALILLGNAIEARARRQTGTALRTLTRLAPARARVVRAGAELEVPLGEVRIGDVVVIRPGERVPVDAVVLEGTSAVDESMLTGESMPVAKSAGSLVIGGTLNGTGGLRARATAVGADSVLSRIVRLMREAQASRAPLQRLADRISSVFVPVVISLAIVSFVAWYLLSAQAPLVHGFAAGIAVLIIACPCAMGLAIPTAMMVATGRGAELGILIKGGEALERVGRVDTVVLDKTGTVTEGKPALTDVFSLPGTAESWLGAVASLEAASEHPLASAIVAGARAKGLSIAPVQDFHAVPGRGAYGTVSGAAVAVGNEAMMEQQGVDCGPLREAAGRLAADGKTAVYAAVDRRLAGVIAVADPIRPSSPAAVQALKTLGLDVFLVTGDNRPTALAVARQVGIEHVVAEVLPAGKVDEVRRLQAEGRVVAMVGDGINDAPALAAADIGIAMGTGTDVAAEAGDLVLMRPDLRAAAAGIRLARRTMETMRQNLFWAFIYNVIGIPVAAGVLYPVLGILLSPVIASGAMALSSVSVVANSLRLRRFR